MREKIFTLLGIESGEESMMSMLLTQSVLLGVYIGVFDIYAHSLFLSTFDVKMLARGYVVSGLTGIILIYIISRLQTWSRFNNFPAFILVFVTLLTLVLWASVILSPVQWIIFLVFIMFGPLNILVMICFREMIKRLFTSVQRKRLETVADTGLISGIMFGSFIIPLLLSFKIQLYNILLLGAAAVFVSALIQIIKGNKFILVESKDSDSKDSAGKERSVFRLFRDDRYLRTIGIFAVLSVLSGIIIQYLFMAVTREQYPVAGNMAIFLGLFTGVMMILVLFLRLVVFKYILYNYGLRTCLILTPLLIVVFIAAAMIAGFFAGYSPEVAGGFAIFFILIAACRLISRSLRESIEFSSYRVIYQSVEKTAKRKLKSGIVGIINEVTVLVTGLILTILGLLDFIHLGHIALFLFLIAILWIFVAYKLFLEYRKSIISFAEKFGRNTTDIKLPGSRDACGKRFSAYLDFRRDYFGIINGDNSVLDKIVNPWYFEKLINGALNQRDINLLPVLRKISNNTSLDENIRKRSEEAVKHLNGNHSQTNPGDDKTGDAIKILAGTRKPQTTEILRLLRENSLESKRLALYMIGKFRITDLLSVVCESLSNPGLAIDASEVLKTFGSGVEDELVRYYLITSGNSKLSKTILQLLGKTCSKETIGFLFSRLWSNSRQLKEIAAKSLINCGFIPNEEEKQRLHDLTTEIIGIITWYLTARISLEKNNDEFLLGKINNEIKRWNRFLFNILSITYKSGSISKIFENIDKGTVESVTFAMEMADIVVSDSVKQKLLPLLDVVPDDIKLKNLLQFFPGDIPVRKKLLEDIINRDYNLINLWTKASALRSISSIEGDDMAQSITALLFSPEEIIQEEATKLLARSQSGLYTSVSDRIPESVKEHLDKIINGTITDRELIFDKVLFLGKVFTNVAEDELLSLAAEMRFENRFDPSAVELTHDYIIWHLSETGENVRAEVCYDGGFENKSGEKAREMDSPVYILTMASIEQYLFQFPDRSFEIIEYIENHET
jgi:ATP:ADP antiporter, AAA family